MTGGPEGRRFFYVSFTRSVITVIAAYLGVSTAHLPEGIMGTITYMLPQPSKGCH